MLHYAVEHPVTKLRAEAKFVEGTDEDAIDRILTNLFRLHHPVDMKLRLINLDKPGAKFPEKIIGKK